MALGGVESAKDASLRRARETLAERPGCLCSLCDEARRILDEGDGNGLPTR